MDRLAGRGELLASGQSLARRFSFNGLKPVVIIPVEPMAL